MHIKYSDQESEGQEVEVLVGPHKGKIGQVMAANGEALSVMIDGRSVVLLESEVRTLD